MKTPICDFVRSYAEKQALRLHMPGHKGHSILGAEPLDITEIEGADSLFEAAGIIRQSEENAGKLFGCSTFYSTEGSSHCIRAMLYLALMHAKTHGKKPLIAAARNVHKTFLSAAALLDIELMWLYPQQMNSYLSCSISPEELDAILCKAEEKPIAVYVTSPDYPGGLADIAGLADVCHRHGILLLTDNAHGAYLRFLQPSLHPIDLGADMCCDSAHKTLPVLTGGAYLHIAASFEKEAVPQAKNALALFGSTSPSYLILQSLDMANSYLEGYAQKLQQFLPCVTELKKDLENNGYHLFGQEPLKICIKAKEYGYSGYELAALLSEQNVISEFADPDHLVLMLTPEIGEKGLQQLRTALLTIPARAPLTECPPRFHAGEKVLSAREAMLAPAEIIDVQKSKGRILAAASVSCPPAVPILICGEKIDEHAIQSFKYYGIEQVAVVK
ncbi:MAG: amino acid decarboxylase [Firmicutes bacterium]|nr:amino acid decarboxylase [Bacillota bacterium]